MKFKVGDKVKVVKAEMSHKQEFVGRTFTIRIINPNGNIGRKETHYGVVEPCGYIWYESELEPSVSEKIVITTEGKTTTATLYRDNEKVTAEAKCSPEDKFDFITGAKLAMHRLVEKAEEVIIDGFKLGERVHYKGHNGTVICFSKNSVGVEFDTDFVRDGFQAHNCEVVPLLAGKRGTKHTSHWIIPKELHHGETKYYNGKVVCVANKYTGRIPLPDFTVGKVYEVVDGVITDDAGWESNRYTDLENLCNGMGNTFIPLVE